MKGMNNLGSDIAWCTSIRRQDTKTALIAEKKNWLEAKVWPLENQSWNERPQYVEQAAPYERSSATWRIRKKEKREDDRSKGDSATETADIIEESRSKRNEYGQDVAHQREMFRNSWEEWDPILLWPRVSMLSPTLSMKPRGMMSGHSNKWQLGTRSKPSDAKYPESTATNYRQRHNPA